MVDPSNGNGSCKLFFSVVVYILNLFKMQYPMPRESNIHPATPPVIPVITTTQPVPATIPTPVHPPVKGQKEVNLNC